MKRLDGLEKIPNKRKNGLEIVEVEDKQKFTKSEREFLTHYAENFHYQNAMIHAGLHIKRNGEKYSDKQLIARAKNILKYPSAKKYVEDIQVQIREQNFLTLDKCVNETYSFYDKIKDTNYREANIAYQRLTDLLGYTGRGAAINQQIIVDETENGVGITINYIQPEKNNKESDE